ncbi:MAG: Hpt domain-containing protein [Treponema sp.]|jgi:HPt (histidine-containing phosphotransfer) domain-containing protein|nr:Hpt domain-containing protein [Treponema sp.]
MNDPDAAAGMENTEETERIFSAAELRENFLGNMSLVRSILIRFIKRTEDQLAETPALVEKGDWDTAVRETHTLKGSARNLRAMDLGDAAMRWEEACRQKDAAAVRLRHGDTVEAFARFKIAAEGFISRREEDEEK